LEEHGGQDEGGGDHSDLVYIVTEGAVGNGPGSIMMALQPSNQHNQHNQLFSVLCLRWGLSGSWLPYLEGLNDRTKDGCVSITIVVS